MSLRQFPKPSPGLHAAGLVAAAVVTTLLFWGQFALVHFYDDEGAAAQAASAHAPVAQLAAASAPRT